jgi:hypothetical protein
MVIKTFLKILSKNIYKLNAFNIFMKKAQFTIDYMSTYSIALFAFLSVMLVLVYIYVTPDTFIRDECRIQETFECIDGLIENGNITFVIRNNLPDNLNITRFECFVDEESVVHTQNFEVQANSIFQQNCGLFNLPANKKVNVAFVITYIEEGKSFLKSTTATLITTNKI